MVEFLEESRGNLLAIRVTRIVDKHNFEAFIPELKKILADYDDPRFYIELPEFDKATPKAILEDFTNLPSYNKFKKIAVVGDAQWKEAVTAIMGAVMSPSAKYFEFNQKEEAISWVKI